MSSFYEDILTEMHTALTTLVSVANGYNYTLTDYADRVAVGDGGITLGEPPFVLLGGFSADPTYGPGATLDRYDNVYLMRWWAYAPSATEYPQARVFAALSIANDVITALQRVHRQRLYPNIGSCTKFLPRLVDTFSDGADLPPGCGVAFGTVSIQTDREEGI